MADVITQPGHPGAAFAPLGPRVQRWRPPTPRGLSPAQWLTFLALHAPLAMLMKASSIVATAHAFSTFAWALALVTRARTPQKLLPILGYIVACESLWRTSHALIFHESSKYALAGLSLLALQRFRLMSRADKTPLLYFALFLPSLLMLPEFDRRSISFNLSGPFALAVAALFLSATRLSRQDLRDLCLTMLGPILGLASVATFSTLTTEEIDYYQSKIASGGLGQNQASSLFGLGALLAFLYLHLDHRRSLRRIVAVIGLWCAAQGALTFSRGGIATAVMAALAAGFFLLRDRRSRGALVGRTVMITAIAVYLVVPTLDSLTNGALVHRFSNTHLTGRDKLIAADLTAFRENPIFGVGPGKSKDYHTRTFRRVPAHTEYSRMLAEHGIFGGLAMLILGFMSLRRLQRARTPLAKALVAAWTVWALLFMFHAAMRMAAASFTFALGAAQFMVEEHPRARRRQSRLQTGTTAPRKGPQHGGAEYA